MVFRLSETEAKISESIQTIEYHFSKGTVAEDFYAVNQMVCFLKVIKRFVDVFSNKLQVWFSHVRSDTALWKFVEGTVIVQLSIQDLIKDLVIMGTPKKLTIWIAGHDINTSRNIKFIHNRVKDTDSIQASLITRFSFQAPRVN